MIIVLWLRHGGIVTDMQEPLGVEIKTLPFYSRYMEGKHEHHPCEGNLEMFHVISFFIVDA